MYEDPAPFGSSARPARLRSIAWGACAALALVCLAFGCVRLRELAQGELAFETEPEPLSAARKRPNATRISARLAELHLERDQHALFELCAMGDLGSLRRDALSILIVHREAKRLRSATSRTT